MLRRGGGMSNRLRWAERVGHCDVHPVQRDTKSALQMVLIELLNAIETCKTPNEIQPLSRKGQSRGRQGQGLGQRNVFPALSPNNPGGGGIGRVTKRRKSIT